MYYCLEESAKSLYIQTKGVVLISILFMLNSHNTAFDNLTVSIASPVNARERVSRKRKHCLKLHFICGKFLSLLSLTFFYNNLHRY